MSETHITLTWYCVLAPKGIGIFLRIPLNTPPDSWNKRWNNYTPYSVYTPQNNKKSHCILELTHQADGQEGI